MLEFGGAKDYIGALRADPSLAVVSKKMAGDALGVSQATIERRIEQGSLHSIKVGGTVCVRASAIAAEIDNADAQVNAVRELLIGVARRRETTTYEPVMSSIGLPYRSPPNRKRIGAILGILSEKTSEVSAFMLSALVFNKAAGRPSSSFFGLAEGLGYEFEDEDEFLREQLELIWRHYGTG